MRYRPHITVFCALVLSASMWFYFQKILIPHQQAAAAAIGAPRGNLSDLYPRWLGARELLLYHRDPYSPEVTREIQTGYYGRVLEPGRGSDPKDQQAFVYPAYVVLLLAPTVQLPFVGVQAGFRWFLVTLTGASVLMWLRAMRWRPSRATTAVLLIFALGCYAAIQGFKLQQLSLVVSGLIAGSVALLNAGYLFLAAVLLALASIKPQLTAPLTLCLLLWAVSGWRSRQRFIWGFFLTMAALMGGAELILPGWMSRFRLALSAYRQYTGGSLLNILITPAWSGVLTGLVLVALAVIGWKYRREPANSEAFDVMVALVLATTVVVVPMFAPYNQLLLLPGVFLMLRCWRQLRSSWSRRLVSAIAVAVIGWPWVATVGLMLASSVVPLTTVQRAWAVPLYTSLGVPLVVLAGLVFLLVDTWQASTASPRSGS